MRQILIVILLAFTESRRPPPRSDTQDRLDFDEDSVPESLKGHGKLFGNVYKDGRSVKGHDDPANDIPSEAEAALRTQKQRTKNIADPNDEDDYDDDPRMKNVTAKSATRARLWFDFPKMHEANLKFGSSMKDLKTKWRSNFNAPTPQPLPMGPYFEKRRYQLSELKFDQYQYKKRVINWTECNELGRRGGSFHPDHIVDLDWVPFYQWSIYKEGEAFIHRFSKATLRMVNEYKEKYGPYLSKPVNWENPKLVLTISDATDFLLIAKDNRGMFSGIPSIKLPDTLGNMPNITIPVADMQLKIIDPYLVLMECDTEYAIAMALDGQGPVTPVEKKLEADSIGFQGIGQPVSRNLEKEKRIAYVKTARYKPPPHMRPLKASMDHGIFGPGDEEEPEDIPTTTAPEDN